MCNDDNGQGELLVDVADELQDGFCRLRIEGRGGLVAEQYLWFAGQCPGDAYPLFLTAGKLRWILMGLVGETGQLQQRLDLGTDLLFRQMRQAQRKCHVIVDGGRGQQVEVLENHADVLAGLAQCRLVHGGKVLAVHDDLAARGPLKHVDAADQCGFSGSAEADDPVDLTAFNGEIDALQGIYRTGGALICLLDMRKLDHRLFTSR